MDEKLSKRDENKRVKKELIISTAEKLFLINNFDNTSMDDISNEAGLTKRTIYKYFNSKEDLFFAVALKGAYLINAYSEKAMKSGINALDKIRLTNKAYYQFYIENPEMFRLMNYQPDNTLNYESSPNYHAMRKLKSMILKNYMDIVEDGKKDGSIKINLDTKKAVYFGLFSAYGLLNLMSTLDKNFFLDRDGLDEREFLLFSMDLFADALRCHTQK